MESTGVEGAAPVPALEVPSVEDVAKRRDERKEEGKRKKRQRIDEAGGKRPRQNSHDNKQLQFSKKNNKQSLHRFGQVMDRVPCRNKPRFSTLTIALPGSVLSNCQTRELKTHLVGQISRACTIYHVDEIVVFDDKLSKNKTFHRREEKRDDTGPPMDSYSSFLAQVLQYCECPQYLRRHFFPHHPNLQFAGLLPPIDAPHHVRVEDRCKYREGVVLEEKSKDGTCSLVNCGVRNRPAQIDRVLPAGIRCTVQFDIKEYGRPGKTMKGEVVSPSAPREDDGTYWGYNTRIASSINKIFEECPYEGGYDLKIGTSERGDSNLDSNNFTLPKYRHALIVFGGVAGIEECVDADETSKLPGSESKKLFDLWVNVCPYQGSRTVRTEEAVLISLAKFSPLLAANEETTGVGKSIPNQETQTPVVEFSDNPPSDESSDSESEH